MDGAGTAAPGSSPPSRQPVLSSAQDPRHHHHPQHQQQQQQEQPPALEASTLQPVPAIIADAGGAATVVPAANSVALTGRGQLQPMTQPTSMQPDGGDDTASAAPCVLAPQQSMVGAAPSQHPQQAQLAQAISLQIKPGMALPLPLAGADGLPSSSTGTATPGGGFPPADGTTALLLRGGSPPAGLIAVSSSSASLASSAGGGAGGIASEGNRTLYLGNLHPFVTEQALEEIFAGLGGMSELKVIKDKATGVSAGYGFAKFTDTASAQAALDRVPKFVLFGQEARVNWAFQKEQKEEVATHFHVFVGDLSSEVSDAMLHAAFQGCPGCSDARVMWDHSTGRSRGYGFVSFRRREEAEVAIQMMHGQFIGTRRVRCGWAQHKTDGIAAADPQVLDRSDPTNTNVYVGNLAPALTDAEVRRQFGAFGAVAEVKLYRKGSYGFVRYKFHQDAVRAIVGMNGQMLGGKVVKCSWGRHPHTPPSSVQTSLMLAAAAGISPLAMNPAAMLAPGAMAAAGGLGPGMTPGGHMGLMAAAGGDGGMLGGGGMVGIPGPHWRRGMHAEQMPMAAAGAQSIIHGGQVQAGMQSGMAGHSAGSASQMLGGGGQAGMLPMDHVQLQQMASSMSYGLPYNSGGMQPGMAFFGGGGSGVS